jgi:YggT family protein
MLEVILTPLFWLLGTLLGLYTAVVIAAVIASWLVAFGVLNLSNPLARQLMQILDALTEPVFRRVRKIVPPIGGLDLSPVVVLIAIQLVQIFLDRLYAYLLLHFN